MNYSSDFCEVSEFLIKSSDIHSEQEYQESGYQFSHSIYNMTSQELYDSNIQQLSEHSQQISQIPSQQQEQPAQQSENQRAQRRQSHELTKNIIRNIFYQFIDFRRVFTMYKEQFQKHGQDENAYKLFVTMYFKKSKGDGVSMQSTVLKKVMSLRETDEYYKEAQFFRVLIMNSSLSLLQQLILSNKKREGSDLKVMVQYFYDILSLLE